MVVCEHDVRRWEPESREEAEAASRALHALSSEAKQPLSAAAAAQPKQLRIQAPGDDAPQAGLVRRSFSMMGPRSGSGGSIAGGSAALAPGGAGGGPPDLSRLSSGSVRSLGGASASGSARGQPSFTTHAFSSLATSQQQQRGQQQQRYQRIRSGGLGTGLGMEGGYGSGGSSGAQRIVSIGSPQKAVLHSQGGAAAGGGMYNRRSTYAGGGGGGASGVGGMTSARSFTMSGGGRAASFGARSDLSSLSSWQQRPQSEDGGGGGGAEHGGEYMACCMSQCLFTLCG